MTNPRAKRIRGDENTRFWPKVNKGEGAGCWLWTAAVRPDGYGVFRRDNSSNVRAHVWAWTAENGPVPDGLELDHYECDTPACVRPSHLRAVTHLENCRRSRPGGRAWRRERSHCKHGHAFTEENTVWRMGRGRRMRFCRTCIRETARRYRQRKT